jgi:hypothetical protein
VLVIAGVEMRPALQAGMAKTSRRNLSQTWPTERASPKSKMYVPLSSAAGALAIERLGCESVTRPPTANEMAWRAPPPRYHPPTRTPDMTIGLSTVSFDVRTSAS